MQIEERLVRELPEKSEIQLTDYLVIEDLDGTKIGLVSSLRRLMMDNLVFNTVEDMKSADVHDGDYCITLGYHKPGDGGAGVYMIVYEPVAIEDGANWHYLYKSDVNRAKFISLDGSVTPEQFGAYGDGARDDTAAIEKCIASGYKVNFIQRNSYKISSPLELKTKLRLNLNGCTIKPYKTTVFAISKTNEETLFEDIIIENGIIDMTNAKSNNVLNTNKAVKKFTIKDLSINNGDGVDISIDGAESLLIENCKFKHGTTKAVAIELNKAASGNPLRQEAYIKNCYFENCLRAITAGETGSTGIIKAESCAHTIVEPVVAATTFLYNGRTSTVNRLVVLDGIHTTNVDSVLNSASADNTTIKDIYMHDGKKLLDATKAGAMINIEGSIVLGGNELSAKLPVFGSIAANVTLKTIPVVSTIRHVERNASNSGYTGTVYDTIGPHGRPIMQTNATATLSVSTMGNAIYEFIASGVNLKAIDGGLEGQVLILKFKNAAKIYNSGTISLNDSATQTPLSVDKGGTVMFKCRQGKFIQI